MIKFESELVQKALEPTSLPEPSAAELPAQESSPAPSTSDQEDIS